MVPSWTSWNVSYPTWQSWELCIRNTVVRGSILTCLGWLFALPSGGGVKGGHWHETTNAWITLMHAICMGMKMGYPKEEGKQAQE